MNKDNPHASTKALDEWGRDLAQTRYSNPKNPKPQTSDEKLKERSK